MSFYSRLIAILLQSSFDYPGRRNRSVDQSISYYELVNSENTYEQLSKMERIKMGPKRLHRSTTFSKDCNETAI